jgi:hypothetical protein
MLAVQRCTAGIFVGALVQLVEAKTTISFSFKERAMSSGSVHFGENTATTRGFFSKQGDQADYAAFESNNNP